MSKAAAAAGSGLKRAGNRKDPLGPNSEIGRKLKQYYEDLVAEAVPERFQDLLRQLEEREQQPETVPADTIPAVTIPADGRDTE